jgi:hypothetical protein
MVAEHVERPNTVFGLQAKKEELIRYRKALEAEVRKVTTDIDHLEAAIRLFTEGRQVPFTGIGHTVHHRAKKGSLKRFVLRSLREAATPLTSAQITDLWLTDRALEPDDQTRVVIRRRVGSCLIACRARGEVRNDDTPGRRDKGWLIV